MTLRATTGILSEIVAHKHSELRQLAPLHADLERRAYGTRGQRRPFLQALRSRSTAIDDRIGLPRRGYVPNTPGSCLLVIEEQSS